MAFATLRDMRYCRFSSLLAGRFLALFYRAGKTVSGLARSVVCACGMID
jgi:hypothetical protein